MLPESHCVAASRAASGNRGTITGTAVRNRRPPSLPVTCAVFPA